MVDIPALVLLHDEQAVLAAVEMALVAGVPTKTHVLNLLHRLLDGKTNNGPDIDSFRFKASSAAVKKKKEATHVLTTA